MLPQRTTQSSNSKRLLRKDVYFVADGLAAGGFAVAVGFGDAAGFGPGGGGGSTGEP